MKTIFYTLTMALTVLGLSYGTSNAVAQGIDIQSTLSGEWSNPANWDCNCVPTEEDNVVISAGTEINVSQNASAHHLTIENAAILQLNQSLVVELMVLGDWNNTGDFQAETGRVIFSGTDTQTVTGITEFYDLSIENDHDVVLDGECNIARTLSLSAANLITNGNLTLKSVDGVTASITALVDGYISGTVKIEKSFQAATAGWLQFGAPYLDVTMEQLNDDLPTTGYPGSNYPSYAFVSVRSYNESSAESGAAAYNNVEDASELIQNGTGYYLYSNAGSFLLDFEGTIASGDVSFPITYTDNDDLKLDGLNLVANPYPGRIDWRSEEGWSMTNMSGALYLWDSQLKKFKTYLNGYSVNNGSPIIGVCDAFWIQANGASPELSVNELAKTDETTAEVNMANDFLKMRLSNSSSEDEFIVILDSNSTTAYESDKDAFKFENSANPVNISTRTSDEELTLCINSVPTPNEELEIPVVIRISNAGDYTLETQNMPQIIGDDRCFGIEDLVTGEYYPLSDTTVIEFSSQAVTDEVRFMIRLGEKLVPEVTHVTCFGELDGQIAVSGTGEGPVDLYLLDADLNEVASQLGVSGPTTFTDLVPGTYTVEVHSNENCAVRSVATSVYPAQEISAHAILAHVPCFEDNTGSINLIPTGGNPPYTFEWSNGPTTEDQENLPGGDYVVTITDENGCTKDVPFIIFEPEDVVASFTTESQTVNLVDGEAIVEFTNNTTGATEFEWNFDDGSPIITEENPVHSFTEVGFYIVSLNANNGNCQDSYQSVINVQPATGIEELGSANAVRLSKNNAGWYLEFDFAQERDLEVNVYNLLGQQLIQPVRGNFAEGMLSLGQLNESAIKLIEVRDMQTGEANTFKVMH